MKKAIALLFSLVLCLTLCACGQMDGAEAAALYPDIIGGWGTDIFGDEFVLCLEKDGTCTILDYTGTWTLDEKASNEEWVELAVTTDNAKYFVRLDRYIERESFGIQYTNLLIMDAKQETVVYENRVFSPDGTFLSTQDSLQALPKIVGEWGSSYWHEDSALTIHEDGTCTLLQQPGRWCVLRNRPPVPDTDLFVKLDNGEQYQVYFWLDTENDWGHSRGYLDILRFDDHWKVFPEEEQPAAIVNRSEVIHPLEFASIAVGEWTESESAEPFAIIREDGTCTIRGADGLWTLDYIAYYEEKFRNGWDYCLIAEIDGEEYDVRFSDEGSDKYHMYIMNPSNGLSLLEAGYVHKDPVS